MNEDRNSPPLPLLQDKQTEIIVMTKFYFNSLTQIHIHTDWILKLQGKIADGPSLLGSPHWNQEGRGEEGKEKACSKTILILLLTD